MENGLAFPVGNLQAHPIEAFHNRLQVFGYRIKDIAYLTDVKSIDDKEIEKIKGVKVLCVNALRIESHHSHFNLEEALAFVEKVQPERAYFTHISHYLGFHEEVERTLPKHVYLAYDNLIVTIDK